MQISRARVRVLLKKGTFFQRKGMFFGADIGCRVSVIGH